MDAPVIEQMGNMEDDSGSYGSGDGEAGEDHDFGDEEGHDFGDEEGRHTSTCYTHAQFCFVIGQQYGV